jgi:hypothetical protein
MSHRGYRNDPNDYDSERFRSYNQQPAAKKHSGPCMKCGHETSTTVAIGPPGDPGNGYECNPCHELRLKAEMWNVDPRRI